MSEQRDEPGLVLCAQCGERAYVDDNPTRPADRRFMVECYGPCRTRSFGATRAAAITEWDTANPMPVPVLCQQCGGAPVIARVDPKDDPFIYSCRCPSCPESWRTFFRDTTEVRVIHRWNARQEDPR